MARVLVVEDEPIIGLQLQESIQAMGYEVPAVIDSGDEVLRAVLLHKPDLILMDINLRSFIDGLDAAKRVKLVCAVPVIFLTADPSKVSDKVLRENIERALKKDGVASVCEE